MCNGDDPIDMRGITAWLATRMRLVGIIEVHESPWRLVKKTRREIRRVGFWRFLDVLAFRIYYRLKFAQRDARWSKTEIARLRQRYNGHPEAAATLVTRNPNSSEIEEFLNQLQPDLMVIRSKHLLNANIFTIPKHGTYALHPGICPEYRNAHGCFWALANRDLQHVGMTLLQVDSGVDTGPSLLQVSYAFDEINESHRVIQYRVILENLDRIAECLIDASTGKFRPLDISQRQSRTWGQPWLSAYLKWKQAARNTSRLCA